MPEIPLALIRQLHARQVVPFVGSGVSLAVQRSLFPTWNELLGKLADRLVDEAKADAAEVVRLFVKMKRLNKAADEALEQLGLAHFRESMQAAFPAVLPDDADLALPKALWSLRPRLRSSVDRAVDRRMASGVDRGAKTEIRTPDPSS